MDTSAPRMAVAIFIPHLNRTHLLKSLIENIREVTPEPHEIYFMTKNENSRTVIKEMGAKLIEDEGNTDYVTRMNAMFRKTTEPYVFTGSDDSLFHKNWLPPLLKLAEEYSVIVPDDMLNPNGTQALISRKYIEEQGGCVDCDNLLFHPEYVHDFCETEQFETAMSRGVFARCMDSVVEHLHWANGKAPHDDDYKIKEQYTDVGLKLFESRKHLWKK